MKNILVTGAAGFIWRCRTWSMCSRLWISPISIACRSWRHGAGCRNRSACTSRSGQSGTPPVTLLFAKPCWALPAWHSSCRIRMISDGSKRMYALSAATACGKRIGREQQKTHRQIPRHSLWGSYIPFGQRRGRWQKHPLRGIT
mgnify:CR=1 FL=1